MIELPYVEATAPPLAHTVNTFFNFFSELNKTVIKVEKPIFLRGSISNIVSSIYPSRGERAHFNFEMPGRPSGTFSF